MGREAATVVSCLAALLSSPDLVSGQTGTPCTFTAPTGASINLASLNKAEGTLGTSPLGNFRINPCQKVTLCDAMQTGSGCCMQLNDTQHPGTSRWISCGVTPKQADMSSASARAGARHLVVSPFAPLLVFGLAGPVEHALDRQRCAELSYTILDPC